MEMYRIYRVWFTGGITGSKEDFENYEEADKFFEELTTENDLCHVEMVELIFKKRIIKIGHNYAIKATTMKEYYK